MTSPIYVINPNSSETVSAGIDAAVAPLRSSDGPDIACLSLAGGPPGIQSQRDVNGVVAPLLRRAAELEQDAAAFVIACFSDPGLFALREQSRRPVFGIAECGVLTTLTLGQRFGVICVISEPWVSRSGLPPISPSASGSPNLRTTIARWNA